MSRLHREIIDTYRDYLLAFKLVELDRNHYLFNLRVENKTLVTGTSIPLGTYDQRQNTLIWADNSNSLDKSIVQEVRKIRRKLAPDIEEASKDISILSTSEFESILHRVSHILNKEILLDLATESIHIHLVNKLLTDDR